MKRISEITIEFTFENGAAFGESDAAGEGSSYDGSGQSNHQYVWVNDIDRVGGASEADFVVEDV